MKALYTKSFKEFLKCNNKKTAQLQNWQKI